jgi:ketosteroid isomerase-like protein
MGELETAVNRMFGALDAQDADAMVATMASEVQGVDEISRKWMRGPGEMEAYIRNVLTQVSDVSTNLKDVHESISEDVGILTCWIDQDYTFQGNKAHVSAPTTVLFRKEGGDWKMSLFHSVPMPEEG